jgi:hypothetical protein
MSGLRYAASALCGSGLQAVGVRMAFASSQHLAISQFAVSSPEERELSGGGSAAPCPECLARD